MATKAQLKTYFETGDKPLSSEFDELIDSCYGTDQQIFFDGTNIRLTRSDGGPDFLANINGHNRQGLTYDTNSRTLNLSGNTASNPVGPILGLWSKAGSSPYYTTDDIYFLNDVGIGAAPSAGYKLCSFGNTWLNGEVRIGNGQTVNTISNDNALGGTGASNARLVTEKAIKEYVDMSRDKIVFKAELEANETLTNGNHKVMRFKIGGNVGFDLLKRWETDNPYTYKIEDAGWYELGLKLLIDTTESIANYNAQQGSIKGPSIAAYFELTGNTGGQSETCIYREWEAVQDSMVSGTSIVKLAANTQIRAKVFMDHLPSSESATVQYISPTGGRCSQMTIKKVSDKI